MSKSPEDFVSGFMVKFKDELTQEAEVSLKEYIKKYKEKLNNLQNINEISMIDTIEKYHKKRKELEKQFNEKLSINHKKRKQIQNQFNDKLNDLISNSNDKLTEMMSNSASKMDKRIANIDHELLCDISYTSFIHITYYIYT